MLEPFRSVLYKRGANCHKNKSAMTSKTSHVPYAQRLARESVKFGLRVGGTLLKHAGLGLVAFPFAMAGLGRKDADETVDDEDIFNSVNSRAGLMYDEYDTPHMVPQDDIDRLHNGFM